MYYTTSQYIEETTTTTDVAATYQTYSTSISGLNSYSSSTHFTTLSVLMTNTYYSKYMTISASNSRVEQYGATMSTSGSSTVQTSSGTTSASYSTTTIASSVVVATQGTASTYQSNGATYISSSVQTNIYSIVSQVLSSGVDTRTSSTHSYTISSGVVGSMMTFVSTWQEFGTTTSTSWTGKLITGDVIASSYSFGTYSATSTTYRTSKSISNSTTSSSYSSGGGAAMTSVQTVFHGITETINFNNDYFYAVSSTYTEAYGGYRSYRLYSGISTAIVTTVSSSTYAVGVHNAGTYSSSNFYNLNTETYLVSVTNTLDNRITYSTASFEKADTAVETIIPYDTSYSSEYPTMTVSSSVSNSASWWSISSFAFPVTSDSGPWFLERSVSGTFIETTRYTTEYTSYRGITYSQLTEATTYYTSRSISSTSYTSSASTVAYTFYYCSSSISIASEVISTVVTAYSSSSIITTWMNSTSVWSVREIPAPIAYDRTITTEYSYSTAW